jgi:hypothetical protein
MALNHACLPIPAPAQSDETSIEVGSFKRRLLESPNIKVSFESEQVEL